jgi:hypothetical protein
VHSKGRPLTRVTSPKSQARSFCTSSPSVASPTFAHSGHLTCNWRDINNSADLRHVRPERSEHPLSCWFYQPPWSNRRCSNGPTMRRSPSSVARPLRSRTGLTTISNSSRSSLPASQVLARTKSAAAIGPPTVLVQIRRTCLTGRRVARRPAG